MPMSSVDSELSRLVLKVPPGSRLHPSCGFYLMCRCLSTTVKVERFEDGE
jgi:hypothetical protein